MVSMMREDGPLDLTRPVRRDISGRPPYLQTMPQHLSLVELKLAEFRLGCTEYVRPVRGLIVGECPGPNTHPDLPLFPHPETSSAGRLVDMAALTPGEYLGGLYRRNLCDEAWRESTARYRAREIITALFDMPRDFRVVFCGNKVADAFEARRRTTQYWEPIKLESRQIAVIIPHPSGLNRMYNSREARLMTGAWIRWATLGEEHP